MEGWDGALIGTGQALLWSHVVSGLPQLGPAATCTVLWGLGLGIKKGRVS